MDARALTFFGVARGGLGKGSHCVTSVESDASVQNDVGAVSSAPVLAVLFVGRFATTRRPEEISPSCMAFSWSVKPINGIYD